MVKIGKKFRNILVPGQQLKLDLMLKNTLDVLMKSFTEES
jgi:hypothetical protein